MIFCLCVVYSFISFHSCNGQEEKTRNNKKNLPFETVTVKSVKISKLDIQEFTKHQIDGGWTFNDKNGNTVHITKDVDEYWEETINKNSVFTQRRNYYLNGSIKLNSWYFHDSGFAKGIWTYYNKQGNVIKIEDNDTPFRNFSWEKV